MRKLFIMNANNYSNITGVINRFAIRGIIFVDNKLLLIESSSGGVKFPGGGIEDNESDIDTLIRETLEETGYHIISESIKPFGEVEEKRLSLYDDKIWHQVNRYYLCDISSKKDECNYSDYEKELGFKPVFYTIDEAINKLENYNQQKKIEAWQQRELNVLIILKQELNNYK